MNLRGKLLLAQAPLAAALLVLGVLSVRTVAALGHSSARILSDNYRSVLAAQRMKEALERIDSAAAFRISGRVALADAQEPPNRKAFERELLVQEHNITESGETEATGRLRALWSDYVARHDRYVKLSTPEALASAYFGELQPAIVEVKQAADRVLEINQDAMVLKSDRARQEGDRYDVLLVLSTIVALAGGIFASVTLTSRVLRPLGSLSLAVREIGHGNLDARAAASGEDEIAQVGRELNTMADRLRQYRQSSLGELLQAQQSSQAAIDSLPDPVLVLGTSGQVLNVNAAGEALLGPAAGQDPLSRTEPALRELLERVRSHVFAGKGAYLPRGYEEALQVSGRFLLPRASPVYSEGGAIAAATIVLQDVTRLLRFDELKNDLVATVAHEFRTPLTSLRMAIHLCLEGAVGSISEKQADLLGAARQDCERLQDIVDDLLDLSRIQAGRIELSQTPLSAKSLVDAAVDEQRGAAAARSLALGAAVVEPVLPVQVIRSASASCSST